MGLHRSIALDPYSALWVAIDCLVRVPTSPKVVIATTLSAYSRGSESPHVMLPSGLPATMLITLAPCEYPPSTILVSGQEDSVDLMWEIASLAPSPPCNCSLLAL